MLRHRLIQVYNWAIEIEATKTSVLHAALYVWLGLGLAGVEWIHSFHQDRGVESVDRLLGGGFWWWNWLVLVSISLVLFMASQFMIFRVNRKKSRYAGYFLVSGADLGALFGIVAYFIALYTQADMSESANWFRMCMAGFIVSALLIFVIRDIHRLVVIEVVRVRRGDDD